MDQSKWKNSYLNQMPNTAPCIPRKYSCHDFNETTLKGMLLSQYWDGMNKTKGKTSIKN